MPSTSASWRPSPPSAAHARWSSIPRRTPCISRPPTSDHRPRRRRNTRGRARRSFPALSSSSCSPAELRAAPRVGNEKGVMRELSTASALGLAVALAAGARADSGSVADVLRRQTQELFDAITSGTAAVWDRYLDGDARYVD